jgi:hypothetical protein
MNRKCSILSTDIGTYPEYDLSSVWQTVRPFAHPATRPVARLPFGLSERLTLITAAENMIAVATASDQRTNILIVMALVGTGVLRILLSGLRQQRHTLEHRRDMGLVMPIGRTDD